MGAIIPIITVLGPLIVKLGGWAIDKFFFVDPAKREEWKSKIERWYDDGLAAVQRRYRGESAKTDLEDEWNRREEEERKSAGEK